MQPTSTIVALEIAAAHYGKTVRNNRDFLLEKVNLVRGLMWKNKAARITMFQDDGCVDVRAYTDFCNTCGSKYAGITLPVNVVGVDRLEYRGRQIDFTDERIPARGCCNFRGIPRGCARAEVLSSKVVLSHDVPRTYRNRLVIRPREAKDKDGLAGIEYVTAEGKIIREDIKMNTDGVQTTANPLKVTRLTLPQRCGFINVEAVGGFIYDTFHPSVIAPSRIRIRLSGVPVGAVVHWFGTVEPMPVHFDTDRVEMSLAAEWKNAFMALDLHFQTSKNRSELQTLQTAVQFQGQSLDAEVAATQREPAGNLRPKPQKRLARHMRLLNR